MEKGIINQSLLEKDIEQITFYQNEENKFLNNIYQNMEKIDNCYKSLNASSILNDIETAKNNVDKIYLKRTNYTKVLNDVISQYNILKEQTSRKFDGGIE